MYKCRLTYDEWKCITSKNRIGKQVDMPQIKGYIGLLTINTVLEKQIWKYNNEDVVVCDNGYHWLTIMPCDEFYCITVMMDNNFKMKVCYIDMIDAQGYDDDNIPYFYDLYLDLVVYPNGDIITDDIDELQGALETGEITKLQYNRAITTSQKLQYGLLSDIGKFKDYIKEILSILESD
ncbi:hypothetical protein IMSAGC011_01590 [Lachnospiraceae bacterium]|nr:hypothetical protein IMSAGC011_01590 [Lachnospiraceae bacterium]